MRALLTAVATALACAGAWAAEPIEIGIENFTAERGISTLILKVSNNTAAPLQTVFIDCAFLTEDERAIDIGKALVSNIPAGGYAYDKASIARTDGVAKAECRVVSYR